MTCKDFAAHTTFLLMWELRNFKPGFHPSQRYGAGKCR